MHDDAPLDPPLHVDWLEIGDREGGGAAVLGMTVLPGKHGASLRYPGTVYRRELERDLARLRELGVRRLVLLVDDEELERWGDPRIAERGRAAEVEVLRFPLPDGSAPSRPEEMDAILAAIDDAWERREGVAVACMGGVGRTGTVGACALVRAGSEPGVAIERVRAVRHPEAVETQAQREFVLAYARRRPRSRD